MSRNLIETERESEPEKVMTQVLAEVHGSLRGPREEAEAGGRQTVSSRGPGAHAVIRVHRRSALQALG